MTVFQTTVFQAPAVKATVVKARLASCAIALSLAAAAPAHAYSGSDAEFGSSRTSLAGNYLAGRVAGAARDASAAASFFRAALREDPRNVELLERTFLLTLVEGDADGAMRLAERVVASDPSNRVARLALAVRAIRTHNYGAARHHLDRGAKGPLADLTTRLIEGWAWLGSERADRGLESVDKLQGADFFGTFRDYHAAIIADLGGRNDEAAKRFASATSGDNSALRIAQAAAIFKARTGDKAGALAVLDQIEKVAPRHPLIAEARLAIEKGEEPRRPVADVSDGVAEVLYGIGGALGRQGGEDLSLVYLQLALYVEPEHPMALVTLADLYDQLEQWKDAIAAYSRVPAKSALKRNAEIQTAIDLDRMEKTDEAIKRLEALTAQSPNDQEAIVALGNIQRGREKFREAAETYSRAIAMIEAPKPAPAATPEAAPAAAQPAPVAAAPSAPEARTGPAVHVVKSGESLWSIAERVLGDSKRWPELAELSRSPQAAEAGAVRIAPNRALQPGQKVLVPAAAETPAPAVAAAAPANPLAAPEKATDPSPVGAQQTPVPTQALAPTQVSAASPDKSVWSLYYVRGIAFERSKQWPKAEADLKRALELSPDQPLVMNYLGYSWIDQQVNLDEGMKLIRRAVELRPDDGYIVDSLGWAFYRLGKYEDAVRELERAVELRPQDPVMNDHLGDAYWKVGRKIEAQFQWSHAVEAKPEPEDLKKIEAKLKDGLPEEPKTNAADATPPAQR